MRGELIGRGQAGVARLRSGLTSPAHGEMARLRSGLTGPWHGGLEGLRYELIGRGHAATARLLAGERGQGTVEYVGLVLLVAVLIAGVVKASGGFSDTGIADAVVKKIKGAIAGVGEG